MASTPTPPARRNSPSTNADNPTAARNAVLAQLSARPSISTLGPIAARFVYSLRLVALHERARRDPVPELAARLGSMDVAAKSLALSQSISALWPENVHVSRFCCSMLTHDETTVGALIDYAVSRDKQGFERQVEGLIRPARIEPLWDVTLALVMAEMRAA